MEPITVTIDKKKIDSLVKKESFNSSGSFVPYMFIGMYFAMDRDTTAVFYANTQPSENSWTNFPGEKMWENHGNARNKKSDIIAEIESNIKEWIKFRLTPDYFHINFELINF
jgi:hypothetical protein